MVKNKLIFFFKSVILQQYGLIFLFVLCFVKKKNIFFLPYFRKMCCLCFLLAYYYNIISFNLVSAGGRIPEEGGVQHLRIP